MDRSRFFIWCKQGLDLLVAFVLTILFAPLIALIAVAVKMTSSGPVLYSQVRTGLNGRPFHIYKVRTMYHDCERLTGPQWCKDNDPRITLVGRFLRKSHLDELPQVWNVLKGEMSLVGPRPERPEFVAELEKVFPRYLERLQVKPGLTGLAQVNLPPDVDQESVGRKLVHDLFYIENRSIAMDFQILVCTGLFLLGIPFRSTVRLIGLYTCDDLLNASREPVETRTRTLEPIDLDIERFASSRSV